MCFGALRTRSDPLDGVDRSILDGGVRVVGVCCGDGGGVEYMMISVDGGDGVGS